MVEMGAKEPWLKFWVDSWLSDEAIAACSLAAQGLWIRLLCRAFKMRERGVLKSGGHVWGVPEIAAACGCSVEFAAELLDELLAKGVVSRRAVDGAIYNRRLVREEKKRRQGAGRVERYRDRVRAEAGDGDGGRFEAGGTELGHGGAELGHGDCGDVTLGNAAPNGGNGLNGHGDAGDARKCNAQRIEDRGKNTSGGGGAFSVSPPAPALQPAAFASLTPSAAAPVLGGETEKARERRGPSLRSGTDVLGKATAEATATANAKATADSSAKGAPRNDSVGGGLAGGGDNSKATAKAPADSSANGGPRNDGVGVKGTGRPEAGGTRNLKPETRNLAGAAGAAGAADAAHGGFVQCDYVYGFEETYRRVTGGYPGGRDARRRELYLRLCKMFGEVVVLDALERWARIRGGARAFRGRHDLAALDFLNGEAETEVWAMLRENAARAPRVADARCEVCSGSGTVLRGDGKHRRVAACVCVK